MSDATLTPTQERMLEALAANGQTPCPPGVLGCAVWDAPSARKPQHYARPAARVLYQLRAMGLAREETIYGSRRMGWTATAAGLRRARS